MVTIITETLADVEVLVPLLWQSDAAKQAMLARENTFAVTLDSCDTTGAYPLKVSRHFDQSGKHQIGVGERPGSKPLKTQIESLREAPSDRPVVLLEDDMACFTLLSLRTDTNNKSQLLHAHSK